MIIPITAPERQLVGTYGAGQAVRVVVWGLPGNVYYYLLGKVRATAPNAEYAAGGTGGQFACTLAPVDDIQAIAAKLDFGEVTNVDTQQRVITVRAIASKLPEPLGIEVTHPSNPDFYRQNLIDLKSFDPNRRSRAIERLATEEPRQLRAEIAAALRDCMLNPQLIVFDRREALAAYAKWAESDVVPTLVGLLDDEKMQSDVIRALGGVNDQRAIEPVAEMLGKASGPSRIRVLHDAAAVLKAAGPSAEDAVLEQLRQDHNAYATQTAAEILQVIGTRKSIPALEAIVNKQGGRHGARSEAQSALKAIQSRTSN